MNRVFAANILALVMLAGAATAASGDVLAYDGAPRYWVGDVIRFCATQPIDDNFTITAWATLVGGNIITPDSEGCGSIKIQYIGTYTISYRSSNTTMSSAFTATHGSGLHAINGPILWAGITIALFAMGYWYTSLGPIGIFLVQFVPVEGVQPILLLMTPFAFLAEHLLARKNTGATQNGPDTS